MCSQSRCHLELFPPKGLQHSPPALGGLSKHDKRCSCTPGGTSIPLLASEKSSPHLLHPRHAGESQSLSAFCPMTKLMVMSSTGNALVDGDSWGFLPRLSCSAQGLVGPPAQHLLANRAPLHRTGHAQGLVGVTQTESHSGQWQEKIASDAMSR